MSAKAGDERPNPGAAPMVPTPAPTPLTVNSVGRLQAAEADVTVDDEIISTDGNKLAKEIQKFAEWEDASDERIEAAIGNIDDWKRKFAKIQDRLFSIKRNVLKFNLSDIRLKALTAFINILESEMDVATESIKNEDET